MGAMEPLGIKDLSMENVRFEAKLQKQNFNRMDPEGEDLVSFKTFGACLRSNCVCTLGTLKVEIFGPINLARSTRVRWRPRFGEGLGGSAWRPPWMLACTT